MSNIGCDYNKFELNFVVMLKSKRARYYANYDFGATGRKLMRPAWR